jgi:hypothetical protein
MREIVSVAAAPLASHKSATRPPDGRPPLNAYPAGEFRFAGPGWLRNDSRSIEASANRISLAS